MPDRPSILITGFPNLLARKLVRILRGARPEARLVLLAQPKWEAEARAFAQAVGETDVQVLLGDVADMHLGLSGNEYRALCETVTEVFHCASGMWLGLDAAQMFRINVEGTKNALELAADARGLSRFNHLSTAHVSGDRVGVIDEDELAAGQRFRNDFEESKFEAELLVRRAMAALPATIFRPSIVVGDSRTGEIDRFEGPYAIAILLVASPVAVPLPLPGNGVAPLNVVPIDFVAEAMARIGSDPRAVGRTFHLVDPAPMAARRVYEIVAAREHRRLPRLTLSYRLADAVLKVPVLEKLAREQRMAIAYVNHLAFYSCRNTLELLDGTGVRCPPITSYLDKLIDFAKDAYRRRRATALGPPGR